jgi:hypothetical protein
MPDGIAQGPIPGPAGPICAEFRGTVLGARACAVVQAEFLRAWRELGMLPPIELMVEAAHDAEFPLRILVVARDRVADEEKTRFCAGTARALLGFARAAAVNLSQRARRRRP